MNATEEWLRYIENQAIMNEFGVKGYDTDEDESKEDDSKENPKS